MPANGRTCETCDCYDDPTSTCRANPPFGGEGRRGDSEWGFWPTVRDNDWCCMWRAVGSSMATKITLQPSPTTQPNA